jgi:uncharacterized protein
MEERDMDPIDVVRAVLADPTNMERVAPLVSDDFVYVSLNYDNPDLQKIMPWCGTNSGVESFVENFRRVQHFWQVEKFDLGDVFASGERVAVFGRFVYTSTKLKKRVVTPMAIFAKVVDGKLTYFQFMEDTFATSASFRSGGQWSFASDPEGGEVTVPDQA